MTSQRVSATWHGTIRLPVMRPPGLSCWVLITSCTRFLQAIDLGIRGWHREVAVTEIREVLREVLRTWLDERRAAAAAVHALIFTACQKPSISHISGVPAYDEKENRHDHS